MLQSTIRSYPSVNLISKLHCCCFFHLNNLIILQVYLLLGNKLKRFNQRKNNESINNAKEKAFESKQSSKSIMLLCNTDQVLNWPTNSRLRENNFKMNTMIELRKRWLQYHTKERILRISFHNKDRVNCLGTNQSFNRLQGKSSEPHV